MGVKMEAQRLDPVVVAEQGEASPPVGDRPALLQVEALAECHHERPVRQTEH